MNAEEIAKQMAKLQELARFKSGDVTVAAIKTDGTLSVNGLVISPDEALKLCDWLQDKFGRGPQK